MGKSGARRKKGANGNAPSSANSNASMNATTTTNDSTSNGGDLESTIFLKRAHELKEEGNHRFQSKDYAAALHQYEQALNLIPRTHPDRAVFHSNRAACLLQMKPVQFDAVISECTLALAVQPNFPRALLRRARAFEALGKLDSAVQDVAALLNSDPSNQDALELARRLRIAIGALHDSVHQDQQRHRTPPPPSLHPPAVTVSSSLLNSSSSSSSSYSGTSPAALGASAVPGAPIAGLGPCLPARSIPLPKKKNLKPTEKSGLHEDPISPQFTDSNHNSGINGNGNIAHPSSSPMETSKPPVKTKPELPSIVLKPSKAPPSCSKPASMDRESPSSVPPGGRPSAKSQVGPLPVRWRPLKLVYDHDIRLAQMPVNCSFKVLREIVAKRFSSSKSVLIKYKDLEGDLVTITGTKELRFAESCNDRIINLSKKKLQVKGNEKDGADDIGKDGGADGSSGSQLESLRLHVMEVSSEQEPPIVEEDEEEEQPVEKAPLDAGMEDERIKEEETSHSSVSDSLSEDKELAKHVDSEDKIRKEKNADGSQHECKEFEIDDWLFEFAQLFRSHVGIDPDAYVDLHELGMELCSEALEEIVSSEEAQTLFEMAACKFQEVAALAFFNWGNVHMCAARKRIPLDEASPKEVILAKLQAAYNWVQERYLLAGQKYEEALQIKPDFYEGLLALGQQHFEMAKLQCSYALASKVDLMAWDSSETLKLFDSAEKKMKGATEMWEKLEEQRNSDVKDPITLKREEILSRKKKAMTAHDISSTGDVGHGVDSAGALDEAAEQAAVMRSQIHLFWGNMLFERSQVEFKLGNSNWKRNLDDAVERFKLAGASETDIAVVLKNHSSNNVTGKEDGKKTKYSALEVNAMTKVEIKDMTTPAQMAEGGN